MAFLERLETYPNLPSQLVSRGRLALERRLQASYSEKWPLKATERVDKYNVFAITKGGGTTGQAESIMLGVARALLAHEPALKPALRRGEQNENVLHTRLTMI